MNKIKQIIAPFIVLFLSVFFATNASAGERIEFCQTDECKKYFVEYKKSVKRGHPLAMLTLAQFYLHGYGTEINEKLALKYFKKAAKHGFTSAQLHAGYIFMTSESLKDIDESIRYLSKAAKYDDKNANFLLALIHYDNIYQRRDLAKVDKYLSAAYDQMHRQVPEAIKHIKAAMPITEQSFPLLAKAMNKVTLIKDVNGELVWPEDEMEIITVTSPPLTETFYKQLMSFRRGTKSTGTRFRGKSCLERLECAQMKIDGANEFWLIFTNGFSGGTG